MSLFEIKINNAQYSNQVCALYLYKPIFKFKSYFRFIIFTQQVSHQFTNDLSVEDVGGTGFQIDSFPRCNQQKKILSWDNLSNLCQIAMKIMKPSITIMCASYLITTRQVAITHCYFTRLNLRLKWGLSNFAFQHCALPETHRNPKQ